MSKKQLLVYCLLLSLTVSICASAGSLHKTSTSQTMTNKKEPIYTDFITMSEYYANSAPVSNTTAVLIQSVEDFMLFQKCITENRTKSIHFLQTQDIYFSHYTFQYHNESRRTGIYDQSTLIGTMDCSGSFYKDYTTTEQSRLEDLGITQGILTDSDSLGGCFAGIYDGGGYSICGMLALHRYWTIRQYTIFGDSLSNEAQIHDVTITDCLNQDGMNSLYADTNLGTITDCFVKNSIFMQNRILHMSGIVTNNERTILRCIVSGCTFVGIGSTVGTLSGIASNNQGSIASCKLMNTLLMNATEAAGIVASTYCQVTDCIVDSLCLIANNDSSAGIALFLDSDYQEETKEELGSIENCHNHGIIAANNFAAGIVIHTSEHTAIRSCTNEGSVNLYSPYGSVGGIICLDQKAPGTLIEDCQDLSSSATPIPTPIPTPIVTPIPTESCEPSPSPTWQTETPPLPTPTQELVTAEAPPSPTPVRTPVRTPVHTSAPIFVPTEPVVTPTISSTPVPVVTPTSDNLIDRTDLSLQINHARLTVSEQEHAVSLHWTTNPAATRYDIYRSEGKHNSFRRISIADENSTQFTDISAKRGRIYYYYLCAITTINNGTDAGLQSISGSPTKILKAKIPWLMTPSMHLVKRETPRKQKYIQLQVSHYEGTSIEVSLKQAKGKFTCVPLNQKALRKNHGRITLKYTKKGVMVSFRVRTWQVIQKKKRFSAYSKIHKIRL